MIKVLRVVSILSIPVIYLWISTFIWHISRINTNDWYAFPLLFTLIAVGGVVVSVSILRLAILEEQNGLY